LTEFAGGPILISREQRGFAGPISHVLDCAVPKKDLISILQEFTAKHPRRFCIPMGVLWIALGIFDALTKLMAGTFKAGNFWANALHVAPPIGYILVGILWILIDIFKIGLSKESD
jgi:hypothetical protein